MERTRYSLGGSPGYQQQISEEDLQLRDLFQSELQKAGHKTAQIQAKGTAYNGSIKCTSFQVAGLEENSRPIGEVLNSFLVQGSSITQSGDCTQIFIPQLKATNQSATWASFFLLTFLFLLAMCSCYLLLHYISDYPLPDYLDPF